MGNDIVLKSVNDLLDQHFYIPYYQRGYRWTSQQVKDLLDDIWAFSTKPKGIETEFYCLQPIVVKHKQWEESGNAISGWEVIDGQQRLTTIHIILSYLAKEFLKVDSLVEEYGKELYSIRYETRPKSHTFLKDIKADNSNIDFYHISAAYNTVKEWFTNGLNTKDRTDRNNFLATLLGKKENERSVQVIWYKVEPPTNSIELFTRLNIGKIPLTNAELIKALFLSSSSFSADSNEDAIRKKMEISQLWDEIEQKLNDENFWCFITNNKQSSYSTKIELLFDLISHKGAQNVDPLHTFLYFSRESKKPSISLWKLWLSIEQYFQTLCQWNTDKNLYHKIGYLITVGQSLSDLIALSLKAKKTDFEAELDKLMAASISFHNSDLGIEDLNFEDHYTLIYNILVLFNIESIRKHDNITEYYPFKAHKNLGWSLEHIHAQNSEGLEQTKKEPWLKWLQYHRQLIEEIVANENDINLHPYWTNALLEIDSLGSDKITWEKFKLLSSKITNMFTDDSDDEYNDLHSISNLALLSQADNSALNNSVFEVKRREIIRIDKSGSYIPICTKRVFFKYYNSNQSNQQYYFWSSNDRENYLAEIKNTLKSFLPVENLILN